MGDVQRFRELNTRKCSRLELGGFRPTQSPLATNFALAAAGQPGERWPRQAGGQPMHFICQLNLTEAPFVPVHLADVALLVFFVADLELFIASGCAAETWDLRAYNSLANLETIAPPRDVRQPEKLSRDQPMRGFEGRWSAALDHPLYDDPERIALPGVGDPEPQLEHVYATKLGGYPSNLQHSAGWPGDDIVFGLQINSEAKVGLNWADRGIVYIGRSGVDRTRWAVSCQFY